MKKTQELVSGMMLVEKTYGDLHYLIMTPFGFKAIETCSNVIEFQTENYSKAYIPKDYNEYIWEPIEGSEVILS